MLAEHRHNPRTYKCYFGNVLANDVDVGEYLPLRGTRYLHLRVIFTHTEGNVLHDLVIKIKIITNVSWEKRRVSRSIHEKWLCKVERYSGIWKDNYGIFLRYLSINLCFLYLYYTCYFYIIRYSVFYFYNLWNCHKVLDNGVSEVGWESTEKLCFF